jgi:hypothetical protein
MALKDFWPLRLQWPLESGYDAFTRPVGLKTLETYDLPEIGEKDLLKIKIVEHANYSE